MKYRSTILLATALCFASAASAQSSTATNALNMVVTDTKPTRPKELRIGDKVPDIHFENVLNYKSRKAKLSDFKGKLVILDMWSIACVNCIRAFPEMERLQKEFNSKIQILLADPHDPKFDSEEKIVSTLQKVKTRTGFYPSLPIPIHDSILNDYFPHMSVPHEIWIDGKGKIIAITGLNEISKENISKALEGREIKFSIKNDWAYDQKKPLLVEENGGSPDDFIYRSLFTGYKPGLGFANGIRTNNNDEVIGLYMINKSLRRFIDAAYPEFNGFNENRIVLKVKNKAQYKSEFDPMYAYCYDLTVAPIPRQLFDRAKYLKEDLKRYFNVTVQIEKQKMKCFVVTKGENIINYYSKQSKGLDVDKKSIKKFMHHYPVSQVLKLLSNCLDRPLLDETEISRQFIDIDFPNDFDLTNSNAVLMVLKNIGFNINEEERIVDVIVITDN
jgi:thiol-disulfide isomerase/thioredoxin